MELFYDLSSLFWGHTTGQRWSQFMDRASLSDSIAGLTTTWHSAARSILDTGNIQVLYYSKTSNPAQAGCTTGSFCFSSGEFPNRVALLLRLRWCHQLFQQREPSGWPWQCLKRLCPAAQVFCQDSSVRLLKLIWLHGRVNPWPSLGYNIYSTGMSSFYMTKAI